MSIVLVINIFCFLIVCILLLGVHMNKNSENVTAKRFSYLLWSILAFFLINCLCELTEGNHALRFLSYCFNTLSFLAVDLIVAAFTFYLSALLEENGETVERKLFPFVYWSTGIRMLIVLILVLTGNLFTIENGCYTEQPLVFIPYVLSVLIMILLLCIVIQNKTGFSRLSFTVIVAYILLPVIPIIVEIITDMYVLTSMSTVLSVLMVYVLIQATEIEEAKLKEKLLEEVSTTDLLTKVSNRRAYYTKLSQLSPDRNLGILFCDLNGLKSTNDHYGHKAGDELIKSFASLLTENFRKDEVFRISGDEFVVLVPGITEADFDRRCNNFRSLVAKKNDIGAVGCSYGSCSCVDNLVAEAEKKMYENKKQHYERNGISRNDYRH